MNRNLLTTFVALVLLAGGQHGYSQSTWSGTGPWTNSANWSAGRPINGVTGIIDSGEAQIVPLVSCELYDPGLGQTAPGEILIRTNGTLRYVFTWPNPGVLASNHNLVLDGGTLKGDSSDYANFQYDYDIAVRSDSTVNTSQSRGPGFGIHLYGALCDYDASHTGKITKINNGGFTVYETSTNFTGGWDVQGGMIRAMAAGALGTSPIIVWPGAAAAWWSGGDTNMPSIVLSNSASLVAYGNGTYDMAPGETLTVNGGTMQFSGDYNTMTYRMPVHLSSNVTFYAAHRSTVTWSGELIDEGGAIITLGGANEIRFSRVNNGYTGNWLIPKDSSGYGNLGARIMESGAMGVGGFMELGTNSSTILNKSLTLRNMISGDAGIDASSKILTLEPIYTNATLYTPGLSPGINWGESVGTVAITGSLTFTNVVNFDGGGSNAHCRLTVDFCEDDGSPGHPTNDVVAVTGNCLGITNVDLLIEATGGLQLLSGTHTILSAANDFTGQGFNSVTWNGSTGTVSYTSGAVQVTFQPAAPVIFNDDGASNVLTATAYLNGSLSSTGQAPTQVYVYWGTTNGGTSTGAWEHVADLGFRDPGDVSTNVSGLDKETFYYYRFYATNDYGEHWAPNSPSFQTGLDVSDYPRKFKITFSGYTRTEPLTNFPALVVLNQAIPYFQYSHFASTNGYDLRFLDATETDLLNYEVEKWDITGNSYIWVQVPILASSNDYIWAYYGNPAAAATGAPAYYTTNGATWDSNFKGVWHLTESSGVNCDSTSYGNHGTRNNNVVTNGGAIAEAQRFNGSSAYIGCGNASSLQVAGDLTLSIWVNPNNLAGERGLASKWSGSWCWVLNSDGNQTPGQNCLYFNGWHRATGAVSADEWSYVSVAYSDAANLFSFYRNGQADGTDTQNSNPGTTGTLEIGRRQVGGGGYFSGGLDEVRVESITRSSNWIWACWMNQASNTTFNTIVFPSVAPTLFVIR